MNKAVIDIETSGFSKKTNAIVEIGMIILDDNNECINEFEYLVKPYNRRNGKRCIYTKQAEAIHGVSITKLIDDGSPATSVAEMFMEVITHNDINTIIGHNIKRFDAPWIYDFMNQFGYECEFSHIIDTLELAKKRLPKLKSYSLTSVRDHLKITQTDQHRAIPDADVACEIWKRLR